MHTFYLHHKNIEGKREGKGELVYLDGQRQFGIFKEGNFLGETTIIFPDKSSQSGTFINGKFEGEVTCVEPNRLMFDRGKKKIKKLQKS